MCQAPDPDHLNPDAAVIAAQNDAFRKLACLGIAPDQDHSRAVCM